MYLKIDMMELLKMIIKMEKEFYFMQTEIFIQVNLKIIKEMDTEKCFITPQIFATKVIK